MKVVVKPKHLKGNTYSNGYNKEREHCPLWEALESAGHNVSRVGVDDLSIDGNDGRKLYKIPKDWQRSEVEAYIEAANNGSTQEITVELEPLKQHAL